MFEPEIPLPDLVAVGNRMPHLIELARGKRLLHVGCVDAMLAEERLASGEHLHGRLVDVAEAVTGVDIDHKGIDLLAAHGYSDLHVGDVTEPGWHTRFVDREFDLIMASEVVEHLSNPGIFLDECRALATVTGAALVVTVPNAFRVSTWRKLKRGIEYVHPDHNYWFSYHTITNLMKKHGWLVSEVALYGPPRRLLPELRRASAASGSPPTPVAGPRPPGRVRRYLSGMPERLANYRLLGRSPFHADGLVVTARPGSGS